MRPESPIAFDLEFISSVIREFSRKIKNQKFDFIICRAFAPLAKLLDYSRFFSKKNTSLLFLKGRSVKKEIHDTKKTFNFEYNLYPSQSEGGGYVLKINKFKKL